MKVAGIIPLNGLGREFDPYLQWIFLVLILPLVLGSAFDKFASSGKVLRRVNVHKEVLRAV